MTNDAYISALEKALASLNMNKAARAEILREIQSHANDTGTSLLERFGTPQQLAAQYLDGEQLPAPLTKKAWRIGKNLLLSAALALLLIIAIVAAAMWWFSQDDFNYADEQAVELTDGQRHWQQMDWDGALHLSLEQASLVLYWHDDDSLRISCKGGESLKREAQQLQLRHQKCLIYLPQVTTRITSRQAELVLVRPQTDLDIELNQSKLEIAANGAAYRYTIDGEKFKAGKLDNDPQAANTLRIRAVESSLGPYRY